MNTTPDTSDNREFRPCPQCGQGLVHVGAFWVCPTDGQVPEPRPFTALRIFLSYGHDANEELVRRIKVDLEQRGHDVWFDKTEIKAGDDWRRAITDGILHSQRVVSFLSKHSTRDPGVCRDEIAIAIGVKGGNIQTILVESETEVQPPVNIGHIQWLDMHDWKEWRTAGEATWEEWYQDKLAEIVRVVESDESRCFAGEIETLHGHLKPISSDARIYDLLRKGFLGRTWLFEAVEKWCQDANRDSRLFWITGNPGVGKSAFAAQLTHTRSDTVIAAQFVEWDKPDHRDARRVVRSLAFQLATRLPDYRKLLLTLPEIAELNRKDPAELFDYLLANPLRSVIGGQRARQFIVIDALDEAGEAGRNPLVEMLARHATRLPDWLGLVVTSRPESAVRAPLQGLNPFVLDTRTEANRADLRDYLRRQLAPQLHGRPDADRLIGQILEKSEGVFLYAERFCDDVQQNHLSLDRPEQFPLGLGGIFCQWFQRQFPDLEHFRKDVRPALRAILAAREPLPVEILQRLFNWQDEDLRDFTRTLGSLFPVTKEGNGEVIKPYHKSFADWLADETKAGGYFVSIMEGHRTLAEACWSEYFRGANTMSEYSIRHVRAHLGRIGDTGRKAAIEFDPVYVELLHRASPGERVIRVWISSTFRDMQRERDYLVRFVFPQLREYCEISNVTFVEVDLRWGITQEQVESEQTLDIVLSEIDRCRPYFIGLIGDRYGWIPASIPESTLGRQAWLKQFPGRSTLDIEARYGALNAPSSEALFYFRDPAVSAAIEAEYGSVPGAESPHAKSQLARLKQDIRIAASQGRCSLSENFRTREELGELVLRDFKAKIQPQQSLHMLEVESARHLAFARHQVLTYLPRNGYFEKIDAAALGCRKPLLVTGEVGIGKTALLANWALQRQDSHRIEIVLMHFAGSVPESTDPIRAMRRIMHHLHRSCYLSMEVPESDVEIQRRFHEFVRASSEGERIIFVVDGLDSFDSCDAASGLDWLLELPSCNCGVIVSCSEQQTSRAFRAQGWSECQVLGLTIPQREELVARFLSTYSRSLASHQVERIASCPQAGNPLYLTSLLDELRIVGSFERLETMIEQFLTAASVPALLQRILERLESDFGEHLVKQSLSLVWQSSQGISEEEILESVRRSGLAVSAGDWIPFARAARSILLETAGRFQICHAAWRTAVRNRYFGQE